jgi:cyclase
VRQMIYACLLAVLLVLGSYPASSQDIRLSAVTLSSELLLVTGSVGNRLVAIDQDGLILVDGVPEQYAAVYLAFVREQTGVDDIKALILTHWHPEVAGLNAVLGAAGIPIYAHESTRQWLTATIRERGDAIVHRPVPLDELPGQTFDEELSLPFRSGSIQLGHMLQAHTDGDIYVYFPDQKIIYAGDVVKSDQWATPDLVTNGFIGAIIDGYETILRVAGEDATVVPASGKVMDIAEFKNLHAVYRELMTVLVAELRKSMSVEEVLALKPAENLKPDWSNGQEFVDAGFRSLYFHLRESRHVGIMP